MTAIELHLGAEILRGRLDDSAPGRDLAALLPLELRLDDYHGIEKVADLPRRLDTSGAPPRYAARAGDITYYAPWGNLALFYKPFQAASGLVRLGEIEGNLAALDLPDGALLRICRAD